MMVKKEEAVTNLRDSLFYYLKNFVFCLIVSLVTVVLVVMKKRNYTKVIFQTAYWGAASPRNSILNH
jgi:hypothetical protein